VQQSRRARKHGGEQGGSERPCQSSASANGQEFAQVGRFFVKSQDALGSKVRLHRGKQSASGVQVRGEASKKVLGKMRDMAHKQSGCWKAATLDMTDTMAKSRSSRVGRERWALKAICFAALQLGGELGPKVW